MKTPQGHTVAAWGATHAASFKLFANTERPRADDLQSAEQALLTALHHVRAAMEELK